MLTCYLFCFPIADSAAVAGIGCNWGGKGEAPQITQTLNTGSPPTEVQQFCTKKKTPDCVPHKYQDSELWRWPWPMAILMISKSTVISCLHILQDKKNCERLVWTSGCIDMQHVVSQSAPQCAAQDRAVEKEGCPHLSLSWSCFYTFINNAFIVFDFFSNCTAKQRPARAFPAGAPYSGWL